MVKEEAAGAIRAIVLEHARVRVDAIRDDHRLTADLGFDSLAFLMTVADVEELFAIHFPLEGAGDLDHVTLGDFVGQVQRLRARPDVEADGAVRA